MVLTKTVAAFTVGLALLLDVTDACSCLQDRAFCDYVQDATVIVRAMVLSRTEGKSINDDTVYDIKTVKVFKGEEGQEYAEDMSFDIVTGGNSALCGIYLEIGEEYLIDLYRSTFLDNQLTAVGSCGLVQSWSSITEEDIALLEDGCDTNDPCEGTCGEFQECRISYGTEGGHYCADTCNPSPCKEDEECVIMIPICAASASASACSAQAVCYPKPDLCGGTCGKFQECLLYTDTNTEEYYCADVCDPSLCDTREVCSLEAVTCVRAPCPSIATCSIDLTPDPCKNRCLKTQECLVYVDEDITASYCADVCDPNPCDAGEVCTFSDFTCKGPAYMCWPWSVCTPAVTEIP